MTENILELLEGDALLSPIGRMREPVDEVAADSTIVTFEVHGRLFVVSKHAWRSCQLKLHVLTLTFQYIVTIAALELKHKYIHNILT